MKSSLQFPHSLSVVVPCTNVFKNGHNSIMKVNLNSPAVFGVSILSIACSGAEL